MDSNEFSPVAPAKPIVHCRHCRYWDANMIVRPTTTPEGLCRRHAPHPALLDEVRDSGTSWPRTFDDDWCGEGEANEPA